MGPNSVGSSSVNEQLYVVAPLVDMPSPTNGTLAGRYAWWVGDEGVKARMNLTNGYQQSQQADDEINSFMVAQRSGVEFMNRTLAGSPNPSTLTEYPGDDLGVSKLQNPEQLSLVGRDLTAQSTLKSAQQNLFHDLSTYSLGVLSDVYAGGLKKDLTADIADTSSTSGGGYRPADDDPIYPPLDSAPSDPQSTKWGLIRSWARTNPPSPGAAVSPVTPTTETAGLYPTIAYFSMGFDYYLDSDQLKFVLYPIISLHNPYPLAIAAADYEVGLHVNENGTFTLQLDPDGPLIDPGGVPATGPDGFLIYDFQDVASINLNKMELLLDGQSSSANPTFIRLKLRGQVIPPGQRHLYVLPDALHDSTYSHDDPPVLERAPDTLLGLGESNYFVLEGPSIDLSELTEDGRVRLHIPYDGSTSRRRGAKFVEFSLALAANNALSGSAWNSTATGIYQAVHDVYPTISHTIQFGGSGNAATLGSSSGDGFYCAKTALGPLVVEKQFPPPAATSAIRIATGYEAGGWWSSQWKMGFMHGAYPSRVIADGSLRAPHIMATSIENYDVRPEGRNRGIDASVAAGIFGGRLVDGNQDQGRDPHPGVRYYRYTTGIDGGPDTGSSPNYSILWDILDSPDRLLSLGQLQHVPFSRYDWQASYLFGNSYASKRIPRNKIYITQKLRLVDQSPTTAPTLPIYDESWLLNRAIWDQYFVSSVPSNLTQSKLDSNRSLPNGRMTPYHRGGESVSLDTIKYTSGSNQAYEQAAANLMVTGAFNINSTSEQAWRALLAGTYGIPLNPDYAESGDTVEETIPYPRFTHNLSQPGDSVYPARSTTMKPSPDPSGPTDSQLGTKIRNTLHLGNRGLFLNVPNNALPQNTSAEAVVAELARSIVQEIRFRGPFLSLADFINRPLTPPSSSEPFKPVTSAPDPQKIAGIKGVLQAGIDNMDPNRGQVNPIHLVQKSTSGMKVGSTGQDGQNPPRYYYDWDREHAAGGVISGNSGSNSGPLSPYEAYRAPFAMAPKMLTQADLLSTLGPALSARSDTFTIRTYGEKLNPITKEIDSRAWCEAVVQRTPDYLDDTQAATDSPAGLNLLFGRRFQIVSFRWLNPNEI